MILELIYIFNKYCLNSLMSWDCCWVIWTTFSFLCMKISTVNILLNIFHYPWRQIGDDDSISIFGWAITLIILCCFHYSIIFTPCLYSRRYNEYHSDEQFLSLNNAHYVLWFCVLTLLSVMMYADSSMNLHCDGLIENTHTHTAPCVSEACGGWHTLLLLALAANSTLWCIWQAGIL